MKKLLLLLLLPLLPLTASYFLVVSSYHDCPASWPNLLPCPAAPLVEFRGFPAFAQNGSIVFPNILGAYAFWFVVCAAGFWLGVRLMRLRKRAILK